MTAAMTPWLRRVIGEHAIVDVPTPNVRRRHGHQVVVEVVDTAGAHWFAKRMAREKSWRAEVRAYRRWVPALDGFAPSLRAADPGLRAVLLEAVPGEPRPSADAETRRRAGVLLRRLHESRPARRQRPIERERTSRWLEGCCPGTRACSSRTRRPSPGIG